MRGFKSSKEHSQRNAAKQENLTQVDKSVGALDIKDATNFSPTFE